MYPFLLSFEEAQNKRESCLNIFLMLLGLSHVNIMLLQVQSFSGIQENVHSSSKTCILSSVNHLGAVLSLTAYDGRQ